MEKASGKSNDINGGFQIQDRKASREMVMSLTKLANLLQCPLCDKMFNEPATLAACGHSFCKTCIDCYCANESICPSPGCGMSTSVRGMGTSFRIVNPQLSQTVESLQKICASLNGAPDHWWMSLEVVDTILAMKKAKRKEVEALGGCHHHGGGDDHDDDDTAFQSGESFRPARNGIDSDNEELDDEHMVDLQAGED